MSEILDKLLGGLSDPTSLLPNLPLLMEKLVSLARWAVMLAPLALLVLGAVYFFLAPKEANHHLGFRFWWCMSSVEVWQFTQKLAGLVWGVMGAAMTVVMFFLSRGYADKPQDEMMFSAIAAIIWELAAVIVSIIAIHVVTMVLFDSKGVRRKPGAEQTSKAAEN